MEALENFLNKFPNKRIILEIDNLHNISLETLAAIKFTNPLANFVLAINENYSETLDEQLTKFHLPYYYNKVITDIDKFNGFLQLNVTDILIGENLGFHLIDISDLAKKYNKHLRCFVNVVQTPWHNKESSITDFFIRPDDIDLYSNYIDTFEFWAEESRQNVLYEVYQNDKFWYGNLEDLIAGYQGHTMNADLLPIFANKRLNCGKKCKYGRKCEWCHKVDHLSKVL